MCRSGSDDRQGNYDKGCKNCERYVSKKSQETSIDHPTDHLDQLHSIKQIFRIVQSLIRDPTTDAVT